MHAINVDEAKGSLQVLDNDLSIKNNTIYKLMKILERRNREWVFISRKRTLFQAWRHAVKQQKAFMICVYNTLNKSYLNKAFAYIKQAAKDQEYETKVQKFLRVYAVKNFRMKVSDSFNIWRKYMMN